MSGRKWTVVIILLLMMLATRILFIENTTALNHIDSDDFYTIAHNIIAGHGFSVEKLAPYCSENVRTPAYPYFLATIFTMFDDHLKLVFIIQSLLDLIVGCCVFRIASDLWSSNRFAAGCIALVCYIFSFTQWRYTNELLAEGLLTPLLMLGFYFLWMTCRSSKYRHLITSAFFVGLAVLCKPNVQFVPYAIFFGIILMKNIAWRKRILLILTFGIVFTLVQAPWYIRNQYVFGEWFLSRTYDDNIARVSGVATLAEIQGESVVPWSTRWENLHGTLVEQAAVEFGWSGQDRPSCAEQDQHRQDVAAVAVKLIRAHPINFFMGHIKPVVFGLIPQEQFYWYEQITGKIPSNTSEGTNAINRLLSRPPLLLAMWGLWLIGYAVMYVGMIAGLWIMLRHRLNLLIVIFALLMVGFFLPGPLVYSRFRAPIVPYIVLLYTIGLLSLTHQLFLLYRSKSTNG